MKVKIIAGSNVYLIAGESKAYSDGQYQGRLLNELKIERSITSHGSAPVTQNLSIRNPDNFIPASVDLWAAKIEITSITGKSWKGEITAYDSDGDGILYIVATEASAPELEIQIPDEIARLVTVDESFHTSAVNVTIPVVMGGTVAKPHLLTGILIDKTAGIYLICVGEIHQVVKVYRGTEELSSGFTAYTGTAGQANYPGLAYIQITDESLRLTDDGGYAQISAEVVGLKLGSHTAEESRNPARFLYWLLKTAKDGVNAWGLGISEDDIDATAFNAAISAADSAGLKLDGVMYFRQKAQSWIDQICLACRGTYTIGEDGKRKLYINGPASSIKTYTKNDIKLLRHGKGAYTGFVYNKGKLDYDYNPLTGQFMNAATYQNSASINDIDEQEFYGQSYLIKDPATAQAILEYTCKRSLIGAQKVYFETDRLPETGIKIGDIITVDYPEKSISGTWQVIGLEIGDFIHTIEAEKFDISIFTVGAPGTAINWTQDAPISSVVLPGVPSGLSLSTAVDYDSEGDGAARPFIEGVFTPPAGRYLGAAVFWGEGYEPEIWNSIGSIRGNSFRVGPVKSNQLYTVKIQLFNSGGASGAISGSIIAGKHSALPPVPGITVQPGFACTVIDIGVEEFAALAAFEIHRRRIDGSGLTVLVNNHRSTRFVDDSPEILQNYTQEYQYQVRAVSSSRQYSAWSEWSDGVRPVQVQSKDITDLPIIGKTFMTDEDVGAEADGVKFTAAGLEMWEAGIRKVLIPRTGNPDFAGQIRALSGLIGNCVIADGGLRSSDFVSGHRGWKIGGSDNAEFNNIRARGAIETAVFKKDEVSVVGGKQMIRPAAVVEAYDYDAFVAEIAALRLSDYWQQLNTLLDDGQAEPEFSVGSYEELYELELAYWMQISAILGTGVFVAAIAEADFGCAGQQAQFESYWTQLDGLLDQSVAVPAFPCSNFAAYQQIELDGWMQANDFLDRDKFEPSLGPDDIRLYVDSAGEFAAKDVVRIKNGDADYWAVVNAVGEDCIDLSQRVGSRFSITPGQAVVNYGKAGSGGIIMDGQLPIIDLYTHTGEPWNGTDIHVRQGNLKGWGGIDSDVYGLAIGRSDGDYFLAVPGQGIIFTGKMVVKPGSNVQPGADATQTVVDAGLVTTGTVQVLQGGTVAAGITGNTSGDTAVRFWAGSTFANRATAPFRVTQAGKMIATDAEVSGKITVGAGSNVSPGADVTQTAINAGLVTTGTVQVAQGGAVAAGMTGNTSGDTAVRFWAGATFANRATAPFRVTQAGKLYATDAVISGDLTGSTGRFEGFLSSGDLLYNAASAGMIAGYPSPGALLLKVGDLYYTLSTGIPYQIYVRVLIEGAILELVIAGELQRSNGSTITIYKKRILGQSFAKTLRVVCRYEGGTYPLYVQIGDLGGQLYGKIIVTEMFGTTPNPTLSLVTSLPGTARNTYDFIF